MLVDEWDLGLLYHRARLICLFAFSPGSPGGIKKAGRTPMTTLHEDTHVEEAEANEHLQQQQRPLEPPNAVEAKTEAEENAKLPQPLQPQKVVPPPTDENTVGSFRLLFMLFTLPT